MRWTFALLVASAGCGHQVAAPPRAPDYTPIVGEAASPQAALYAGCLADAIARKTYQRAHDADTELILFHCGGAPARAFYDGLAAWSAQVDSAFTSGGRSYRATARVIANLFGVDHCSTDGADDYACTITLNAGAFLGS